MSRAIVIAVAAALCACDSTVRIEPGAPSTTTTEPLRVTSVTPRPGRVEVGPRSRPRVTFSTALDSESVDDASLRLIDSSGDAVPSRTRLVDALGDASLAERVDRALELEPLEPLEAEAGYELEVADAVRGRDGSELDTPLVADDGSSFPVAFETFVSPPGPLSGLAAESLSATAARVSWSAGSDNATPADRLTYEVFVFRPGARPDFGNAAARTTPGETTVLVSGLEPGTRYEISVRAIDELGSAGRAAAPVSVETESTIDRIAPQFDGVETVESLDPTSLRVSWSAGTDDRDDPSLLRYRVYLGVDGDDPSLDSACLDRGPSPCVTSAPGATELILTDLQPDTEHRVLVRAVDTALNESDTTRLAAARTLVSFAAQILPIFTSPNEAHCARSDCHSSGAFPSGRLSLDSYDGLLAGGRTREPPIVVPGEPEGDSMRSYLLWRVDVANTSFRGPRMPLGGSALPPEQVLRLRRWISQGALDN